MLLFGLFTIQTMPSLFINNVLYTATLQDTLAISIMERHAIYYKLSNIILNFSNLAILFFWVQMSFSILCVYLIVLF